MSYSPYFFVCDFVSQCIKTKGIPFIHIDNGRLVNKQVEQLFDHANECFTSALVVSANLRATENSTTFVHSTCQEQ